MRDEAAQFGRAHALSGQGALLLGPPTQDDIEARRPQEDAQTEPGEQRCIIQRQTPIDPCAPPPVRVFLPLEGVDGLGQVASLLADAPVARTALWLRLNPGSVNTGISTIVRGSRGTTLVSFNAHDHLSPDLITYR